MKLLQIWNARPAWTTLSTLRKPPGIAYRLLKYERLLDVEINTIDKARSAMVTKAAGAEDGAAVALQPGTPEIEVFLVEFNTFLDGDSELPTITMSMDELLTALDSQPGNALAESDLSLLEPFFTQPLEVVT